MIKLHEYHKPCSVLALASAAIYLCLRIRPRLHFALDSSPTKFWVSRLWGLPVPPFLFPKKLRLCGTFKDRRPGISPLGFDTAVYQKVP